MGTAHGLWLDAMIAFWGLFALLLFVAEPAFLHRRLQERASRDGEAARVLLLRGHVVLLALALFVVAAAVLGAQGAG